MNGPNDGPSQAHDAARQAYRDCPYVPLRHSALSLLMAAVDGAGIHLGAYDHNMLAWLAGAEPEAAVVVAGLVTRARHAGRETAR